MRDPKSLSCCLVEGEEGAALRSPRRRRLALLAAILLQCLILAALVVFPLYAKGERLNARFLQTPMPPYRTERTQNTERNHSQPQRGTRRPPRNWRGGILVPPTIPEHVQILDDRPVVPDDSSRDSISIPGWRNGLDPDGAADPNRLFPKPPEPPRPPESAQKEKRISRLDPGQLVHRVEPVYPPLALQIRLEGTVRLRAVIGTDGAMREVEILGGHPLLVQAARDAVLQWRYKPTVLNGQPVEVETHITVVFTLRH